MKTFVLVPAANNRAISMLHLHINISVDLLEPLSMENNVETHLDLGGGTTPSTGSVTWLEVWLTSLMTSQKSKYETEHVGLHFPKVGASKTVRGCIFLIFGVSVNRLGTHIFIEKP